jgi:ubiquinone/menaquinone biosynthesis C-methylase UbiE
VAQEFTSDGARWAAEYQRTDYDSRRYRLRAQAALAMLDRLAGPGGRVLDVRTGPGLQARAMVERGWSVVGIDLTPAMIAQAATGPGSGWILGSVEELPFSDASFDAVMMLGVIGYVWDAGEALREVRRCLRPGGSLIVSWHTRRPLLKQVSRATKVTATRLARVFRKRAPRGRTTEFYASFNRSWSKRGFYRALDRAGFEPLEHAVVDFGRLRPFGLQLWPGSVDIAVSRAIESAASLKRLKLLRPGAYIHVVRARVSTPEPLASSLRTGLSAAAAQDGAARTRP